MSGTPERVLSSNNDQKRVTGGQPTTRSGKRRSALPTRRKVSAMNPSRIATLAIAAVLSTLAAVASIDHWALAPFLRTTALDAWIIFAGATGTQQILAAIGKLRDDVNNYGDTRHLDGVSDGMSRGAPAQPNVQRIR
jgi:hypothetical protein